MTRFQFLAAFAIPTLAFASDPTSGALTADESREIVQMLEASQTTLLAKVAALNDDQFRFKPADDRWSAAEIVEHLFLAEQTFQTFVDGSLAETADPNWEKATKGQTAQIDQAVPDRSTRVQAPEELRPTGKIDRATLVEGLVASRAETIARAEDREAPYKAHVSNNPVFGPIHAAHWLRFAALHMSRHTKQLDEVLADPKFPKIEAATSRRTAIR